MLSDLTLKTAVTEIPLVGPSKAQLLEKLGITTIKDLLFHIPFKYRDTSNIIPITKLKKEREGTIIATVERIENVYTRFSKVITRAKVIDESSTINILWFNQPYLTKALKQGNTYIFEGKLSKKTNDLVSPAYELFSGDLSTQSHIGKITPFYNETAGISSKWLRGRITFLKKEISNLLKVDLQSSVLEEEHLLSLAQAIMQIHFPTDFDQINNARTRLAFDEMLKVGFKTETNVAVLKNRSSIEIKSIPKYIEIFNSTLPYELTQDQRKAINDIQNDMEKEKPMYRLLNGDVGSGKTVVAASCMYSAYQAGFSSIIMAPTTILATQHQQTLKELLKPLKINVELCASGTKLKHSSKPQIIVGTHALLHNKEEIHNLGLLIVDEQHRFGVKQREQLTFNRSDGKFPHFLMMSATPIPHTLINIFFGDMDVSFIKEMPANRIPIQSHFVPFNKRDDCYEWIKQKLIDTKEQAFIVFPLVEESEKAQAKAATAEYEKLKNGLFKNLRVGLLHGQLKIKEKNETLKSFKAQKYNVLVATSVIEVGIDVPEATVMVIEDAQRFGLAQLHQLRGRVGRGDKQSYCFVLAGEEAEEAASERLTYFAKHPSGFDVAEFDLKKRGPGEVYGVKQSGIPTFKVASINDIELLIKARNQAKRLIGIGYNLDDISKQLFQ
ncbi:ATP-dependent DNA helicase RecG [bacterium]|nr:ATP-dependent DNA helicase RecG [bacterium]